MELHFKTLRHELTPASPEWLSGSIFKFISQGYGFLKQHNFGISYCWLERRNVFSSASHTLLIDRSILYRRFNIQVFS
jgi:hypothetical protein